MVHNRTSFRNILTRRLAIMALLCIYGLGLIGASALLLGVSSTSALARGGHFHGGGFHGRGFGLGYYPYGYYGGYYPYYPYYGDAGVCYSVRRRVMTRYGWRIRRVSVCE
jgi:uncharacterized membrane protein